MARTDTSPPRPDGDGAVRPERLDSWKEIAAYLGRTAKTAQRWHRERGLPVHRQFGDAARPRVYGYAHELDRWQRANEKRAEPTAPAVAEDTSQAPSSTRKGQPTAVLLVALVGAVAAIAFLAGLHRSTVPSTAPSTPRPITYFAGNEEQPALSPDGKQVAFIWDGEQGAGAGDLYVQLLESNEPLRLTDTPEREHSPVWSPGGARIAFLRELPAGHAVVMVPALGGTEEILTSTSRDRAAGLDWSPDGKYIAIPGVAEAPHNGITLFSLETRTSETVSLPPAGPRVETDLYPLFGPDGQRLAVTRRIAGSYGARVLSRRASGGFGILGQYDTRATDRYTWSADRESLIFTRALPHAGELSRLHLPSGRVEPILLAGGEALQPAIRGKLLAYTRWQMVANIQTLALRAGGPARKLTPLISSTRRDHSPSLSPNGQSIAFVSDRTGSHEIWICNRNGSDLKQLTDLETANVGSPKWSPDSRWLTFDSPLAEPGNTDIYIVSRNGGEPRRLTKHPAQDRVPTWSHDGQWIYFGSSRGGMRQVWRVPSEGGEAEQMTQGRGFESVAPPTGQYLYYNRGTRLAGIKRLNLKTGKEEEIPALAEAGYHRYWASSDDGLYFVAGTGNGGGLPDPVLVMRFDYSTQQVSRVGEFAVELLASGPSGLAVDPDESTLLFTTVDLNNKDIMLVEGFE